MGVRILLIEDEPGIARFVQRGLQAHGYQLVHTDNGVDGVLLAAEDTVELVLLDITLPGIDGYEVLRRIRSERAQLPILMLTARDNVANKVEALNAGADDYLTKPFAFEELIARIRALVRRTNQPQAVLLEAGDLLIDLVARRVTRGRDTIELTSREFALLEYFLRHQGQVLSRQQIISAVWKYTFDTDSNVVDVYVRYLRRKLDRPGERSLITAIRGAGYRFENRAGASPAPA